MNQFVQKLIEKTQENYNILAPHFSYTRSKPWPELKVLVGKIPSKTKILDIGCGNGRLLELFKDKKIDYLGIDFSHQLICEAKRRYPKASFKVADITQKTTWENLKVKFDFIFCIAVLHHLPTQKLRKGVVEQICQALKPDGKTFITVWNLWQKKYLKHHLSFQSLKLKWQLKDIKVLYFPYKYGQLVVSRFLYPFTLQELSNLFPKNKFIVEKSWSSGKNFSLVEKRRV